MKLRKLKKHKLSAIDSTVRINMRLPKGVAQWVLRLPNKMKQELARYVRFA